MSGSPSPSKEAPPSSVTGVFVATFWSAPAAATGGRFGVGPVTELFAGFGSGASWVATAVMVSGPDGFTVILKMNRASPPLTMSPIVQMPVVLS